MRSPQQATAPMDSARRPPGSPSRRNGKQAWTFFPCSSRLRLIIKSAKPEQEMDVGFNKEILVKKLTKINNTNQNIHDLSSWCISHHRYKRQVIETWDCEFRTASYGKRVSLLYLANNIMQNNKKESRGYITEFMRVIPAALNEVFDNGGDWGRKVVKRLIDIWVDRKIFDNQEQTVKDDFFRKLKDLINNLGKSGELMRKVFSSYKDVLNASKDENRFLLKCQTSLGIFDNLNKEYEDKSSSGSRYGSRFMKELKEQHDIISNSIEKLKTSESQRDTLISHLKEALYEQELKVAEVRSQLQAAQPRYKKANELCQKLGIDVEEYQQSNEVLKKSRISETAVTRTANVVTKFGARVAPEKLPISVLSSRVSRDNISHEVEHHLSGHKRREVEDDTYFSRLQLQQPPPPPPSMHSNIVQPPPPPNYPSSPPPPPPEYPPCPPPPPTSVPPIIIPPPAAASMPHQRISPISPFANPSVSFTFRPHSQTTGMPYETFPPCTPVVNLTMANRPPSLPGAPNSTPAFQESQGTFYGFPPYSTAPPQTKWR